MPPLRLVDYRPIHAQFHPLLAFPGYRTRIYGCLRIYRMMPRGNE